MLNCHWSAKSSLKQDNFDLQIIQKINIMKKVLMVASLLIGTTVMVNAQEPAKAAPAKEVKATKKVKI